jgi:hypothetical protein
MPRSRQGTDQLRNVLHQEGHNVPTFPVIISSSVISSYSSSTDLERAASSSCGGGNGPKQFPNLRFFRLVMPSATGTSSDEELVSDEEGL